MMAIRMTASTAAMDQIAVGTRPSASSAAPRKNPNPLTAFLDPVSAATQRNRPLFSDGASSLTADFDDILDRSLATPDAPCTSMTKMTDRVMSSRVELRQAASAAICKPSPA